MKKVLIITYYWPPSGGAGVQRWLKFSKYLPEFGWEPIILTVDPNSAAYPQIDSSLEETINTNIEVHRTKSKDYYRLYKKSTPQKQIPYGGFSNESNPTLMQQFFRFVRGNFFIPDPRIGWNNYAYEKALDLIETHHPDWVITTGPPHSTHLIGRRLKRKLGVKWIADFRDPWTDIYYNDLLKQTKLVKRLDRQLELSVLNEANHICVASQGFNDLLSGKQGGDDRKYLVIYNGFDQDDFNGERKPDDSKFVITHSGTIADSYRMDGFIAAISSLDESVKKDLVIRFVGNISPKIQELFKQHGLDRLVEVIGYVDHKKSVEYITNSNLLLLVIPEVKNNQGIVPGKLFEYISTGNKVIGIGPTDGDVNQILRSTGAGQIFYPDEHQEIADFIRHAWAQPEIGSGNFERYSRKEQTRVLAKYLDTWA